ncbi:MAG: hypothetical protein P8Y42_13485 [Exilibacterium sp.]
MGLFSRNNQKDSEAEDLFSDSELPQSHDFDESFFVSDEDGKADLPPSAPLQPKSPAAPAPKQRQGYNIEDAIELMRLLPRDNNEIVVTVVKKTLESTHIEVADIIKGADEKENRLRELNRSLEQEIKELQEQITKRNQRINEIQADLKETVDVRERLQFSLELDAKRQQATTPPAQAKSPATQAKSPATQPQQPSIPTKDQNHPQTSSASTLKEQAASLREHTNALKEQTASRKEQRVSQTNRPLPQTPESSKQSGGYHRPGEKGAGTPTFSK